MSKNERTLLEFFREINRVVVTTHCGYIGRYPENSLLGLTRAVECGTDIIEFDLRGTSDHEIILHHDPALDRISNGSGAVDNYTYDELLKLNFSYFKYEPDCQGKKLDRPRFQKFQISKFEDVLNRLSKEVFMNIQVYTVNQKDLVNICGLFKEFDMYEKAYMTMMDYTEGDRIRAIDPEIELCVLNRPKTIGIEELSELKNYGCRYLQPQRTDITKQFCEKCREMAMYASMFYSNNHADNKHFIELGVQGILTDFPDILIKTISECQEKIRIFPKK